MDNVTHALAGLVLAEATVVLAGRRAGAAAGRGFRRAALAVGVVAAELPDADLAYSGWASGGGKLGYLLHHRGHTHTVVVAVLGALLVWGVAMLARREARRGPERGLLLGLALAGTLVGHLLLDGTNNYGVHPWWPLSSAWHYGDAVFIVEPWLWVVSVPALLALAQTRVGRVGYALALLAIVAASWRVGMVGRGVAVAVTVGAASLVAVAWLLRAHAARLVLLALGGWLAVEATFAVATTAAERQVRRAVAPHGAIAVTDVALSPAIGNPLCFRGLTVELDGDLYRASEATVAPWPALRAVDGCASEGRMAGDLPEAPHPATPAVRWGRAWSAPRAELAALARDNCVVAAALRFIRVPAWRRGRDGAVAVADLRFGIGGFADVEAPAMPDACPAAVPPWTPPREDVLGAR